MFVPLIALLTGCLMPPPPKHFTFKSRNVKSPDSIVLVSYPNNINYQYWGDIYKPDSIYMTDPFTHQEQKMEIIDIKRQDVRRIFYMSIYKKDRWNLKRVRKVDFLSVKKYYKHV